MSTQETPEPLSIQSQDTSASLLVEQKELLETDYALALKTVDSLIEFYSVDPEGDGAREAYTRAVEQLRATQVPLAEQTAKLQQLQREFQAVYKRKLDELVALSGRSFTPIATHNKVLYEQRMKTVEVQSLEKSLGQLRRIELGGEEQLAMSLSKQQVMRLLMLERQRRGALSFKNEQLLKPEIKQLTQEYEAWGKRDNELKRYLVDDLDAMNKKISAVKRCL